MEEELRLFVVEDKPDFGEAIKATIGIQTTFVMDNPKRSGEIIHKFLEFHLSVLGIESKDPSELPHARAGLPNSICPPDLGISKLKPRIESDLKLTSINFLTLLVKSVKKSRVFAFWYVFFPKCTFNPVSQKKAETYRVRKCYLHPLY